MRQGARRVFGGYAGAHLAGWRKSPSLSDPGNPTHRFSQDLRRVPRPPGARAESRSSSTTCWPDPRTRRWRGRSRSTAVRVGNRFCILPMEGWDGTTDGEPSELTARRWRHFGISGAKLMWGCEAVAVRHDGRANPEPADADAARRRARSPACARRSSRAHRERFGASADADLLVGLQLTHSGRYARPDVYDRPAPLAASAHPILDRRFPGGVRLLKTTICIVWSPTSCAAAKLAREAGFAFVDIKHCHGYLGHELLSSRGRARTLRRLAREPHALHARDHRRHPRRRARPDDRRPALGVRHRAVPTRTARHRRAASPATPSGFGFGVLGADGMDAALDDARGVLAHADRAGRARRSASPPARRTTTRTCSGRRCSRRSTATSRPRIRCAASRARSTRRRGSRRTSRTWRSSGSAYSYLQEWLPHVGAACRRAAA